MQIILKNKSEPDKLGQMRGSYTGNGELRRGVSICPCAYVLMMVFGLVHINVDGQINKFPDMLSHNVKSEVIIV